jgi:hypothetical protein
MKRDGRVDSVERSRAPRRRGRSKKKAHWLVGGETLCGRRNDPSWGPLIASQSTAVTCSTCQQRLRLLDEMTRRAKALRLAVRIDQLANLN